MTTIVPQHCVTLALKGSLSSMYGDAFLFIFKDSAALVLRLCLVLQFSPIHLYWTELQYQAQPIDNNGAVSGNQWRPPLNTLQDTLYI